MDLFENIDNNFSQYCDTALKSISREHALNPQSIGVPLELLDCRSSPPTVIVYFNFEDSLHTKHRSASSPSGVYECGGLRCSVLLIKVCDSNVLCVYLGSHREHLP